MMDPSRHLGQFSNTCFSHDVTSDILLAEDNLIVKILEKYGHTVKIAENGSLAVDALKAKESCLILFLYVDFHAQFFLFLRWMYPCHSWVVWKPPNSSVHMDA